MRYSMKEFSAKLQQWIQDVPEDVAKGIGRAAVDAIGHAQSKRMHGPKMPRGKSGGFWGSTLAVDTGRLWRSLSHRVEIKGSQVTAQVGTNVKYARIHEYGGVIVPRTAKYLRFKVGKQWVTTKRVVIPERPFLRPSVQEKRGNTLARILEYVMKGYRRGK